MRTILFVFRHPCIFMQAFWKWLKSGACGEELCCPKEMCHGGPFCLYRDVYHK